MLTTTFSDQVDAFLFKFNSDALKFEANTSPSFHIYNNLEAYASQSLDNDKLLEMFFFFNSYEKCLILLRAGKLNAAEESYKRIAAAPKVFHPIVEAGMLSLFYAMSAYRHYVNMNFDKALEELTIAIANSEKQGKLFPMFYSSIQEQTVNQLRVLFKAGRYQEAVDISVTLINLSLYGIYNTKNLTFTEEFLGLEKTLLNSMARYAINTIINKLSFLTQKDSANGKLYFKKFLNGITTPKDNACINEDFKNSLSVLRVFYSTQSGEFMNEMSVYFESILKSPYELKKLLFSNFLDMCSTNNYDLSKHPCYEFLEAYMDILKIKLPALSLQSTLD